MNYLDWLRKKIFGMLGLADSTQSPNDPKLTFMNDPEKIQRTKLREYNVWYAGDSDNILNFYTRNNMIDYNYEPYFDRNKQSYFWCVSSTELDIKRTHSGQPRNIVDTLVDRVGMPKVYNTVPNIDETLQTILKSNKFKQMFLQEQLPMTLVEGWGCWKINYNLDISDTPILLYYRADACDFIYKSNRLVACIFKDYYTDENKKNYLLIETRTHASSDGKPCLRIDKELFELGQDDSLVPVKLSSLKQLSDVKPSLEITNYDGFLAVPCIIYKDSTGENPGRSIFTGKIDLFDDLDQCLSQAANTVRRSTTKEYFNSNFLERDPETGMPLMPTAFDRKYVMFTGGRTADGSFGTGEPVQSTQPQVNFVQYDQEAVNILLQILNGIMSPATLGIDIAKKDNAEAQREKEKETIFTRNTIIEEEIEILSTLCKELLCANELMHSGKITARDYDVSVKFKEFADGSFESKLEVLLAAFNNGVMSPELFVNMLYGDTMTEKEKQEQIDFIKSKQESMSGAPDLGAMGALLGGMNPYDMAQAGPDDAAMK